jgi:DNA polymerase IV
VCGAENGGVRRVIAHVDIDAFYASVELARRPELRGKPVIVSGSGPRAVVTTASYEARAYGVGSAMPTSQARRLCPDAIVVPPDFTAYREVSRTVWDIVRAEVPLVDQVGIDEAYLDITDLVAPKAFLRTLLARIHKETGLTASVGIGPNKLIAKVAGGCEKPAGMVALSREMACERFASSPPSLLPGIGPKTAARLEAMGITTIAALGETDEAVLVERFGSNLGPWLRRRAHFEDDGRVQTERTVVSQSSERTFDEDISDRAELESILRRLSESLCESLRRKEREGRTIAIKVRLADFTTVTRARTIDTPTADSDVVGGIATELLRAYDPPAPVRLLGVRVAGFTARDEADAESTAQLGLAV